jgi:hypothetical protein
MIDKIGLGRHRRLVSGILIENSIPFKYIEDVYTGLKYRLIRVEIGDKFYIYDLAVETWESRQGNGKEIGKGILGMIFSVKYYKKTHDQRIDNLLRKEKANKLEVKRDKRWNSETKANVLFKLQKAKLLFEEGNSMSKSARLADVEYQMVKEFITTDKFEVVN